VDWEVGLATGEGGKLLGKFRGNPSVVSLGHAGHGNHPKLLSKGAREWEHSLRIWNGIQRVTGDNNKRGCCNGRHAAWPLRLRIQIPLESYELGARDTKSRREQRARADMSDCEDINVELRKVRRGRRGDEGE